MLVVDWTLGFATVEVVFGTGSIGHPSDSNDDEPDDDDEDDGSRFLLFVNGDVAVSIVV